MALTAVGSDSLEPPGTTGCWCRGDCTVRASLVRLGEHPELGVCFPCVRVLVRHTRALRRRTLRTQTLPAGWSSWRRVRYCTGFGRC